MRTSPARFIVSFVLAALSASCSAAAPSGSPAPAAVSSSAAAARSPQMEAWRKSLARNPLPKIGCFHASYPSTTWEEVPCGTRADTAPSPAAGAEERSAAARHIAGYLAGDTTDDVAEAGAGTISWTEGSFPYVNGVSSERDENGDTNSYSLQINTNPFYGATQCQGPNCQGWEQFIVGYNGASTQLALEYYLLNYGGTACPSGFGGEPAACGGGYNTYNGPTIPQLPITDLGNLVVTGTASTSGDSVALYTGDGNLYAISGPDTLNASAGWNTSEFNIFGVGGPDRQANFNYGSTVAVQILTSQSPGPADHCQSVSYTGEYNNLNLVPGSCCSIGGAEPGISFTESYSSNPTAYPCPATAAPVLGGGIGVSQQIGANQTDVFTVDSCG